MTTNSILFGKQQQPILKYVDKVLKERGISRGAFGDSNLRLQLARAAQSDGNPGISEKEASRAIDNYAAGRSPERLPGNDKHMTLVVEDSVRLGSTYTAPDRWLGEMQQDAYLSGVQMKMEKLPGTEKRPSAFARFFGAKETSKYSVTASGERAQVERFFDAYHLKIFEWANSGE